ncbi:hypothetical protein JL720_4045 [Aureococcus anophagefferens]|nr:hypothetical protein JL720_4045 [Aureococcus anophagefferens]
MRRAVAALPLAGSAAAARSQQQPRHRDDEFRVLVVGAGLGGCVCASELRKRFEDGGPTLRLSVWERATYCAGRFGARAVHGGRAVDLGSQVLSVVDPSDARAAPGHGVSAEASIAAFAEASRLARAGLLVPADDGALAGTEERLNWPGLWRHYRARRRSPTSSKTCSRARPADVRFGRRVDAVAVSDRGIVVSATQRPAGGRGDLRRRRGRRRGASAGHRRRGRRPARGAVVAGVAYDARTAAAFFFDDAGGALCANQPLVWGVPTKLQNSLAPSNRRRFV